MARYVVLLLAGIYLILGGLGLGWTVRVLSPILSVTESTCCVYLAPETLARLGENLQFSLLITLLGIFFAGLLLGLFLKWKD